MKYEKLVILIALVFFFSQLSLVSSQEQTLGGEEGFPLGESINLIQNCPNCTYVNITTILLGNKSVLTLNSAMTKDGTIFNLTLDESYVTSIGEYEVNFIHDLDGIADSGVFNLYVRKEGSLLSTAEAILYVLLMIVNSISFLFFFYFAIMFPFSDERNEKGTISKVIPQKYLKLLCVWFAAGTFVWFMNLLNRIITIYTDLDFIYSTLGVVVVYLQYLLLGLTYLILTVILLMIWKNILTGIFKLLVEWIRSLSKNKGPKINTY